MLKQGYKVTVEYASGPWPYGRKNRDEYGPLPPNYPSEVGTVWRERPQPDLSEMWEDEVGRGGSAPREDYDEVLLVLPAPPVVAIGMTAKAPDGSDYTVVRRDDGSDPKTGRLAKTWWECLPVFG